MTSRKATSRSVKEERGRKPRELSASFAATLRLSYLDGGLQFGKKVFETIFAV